MPPQPRQRPGPAVERAPARVPATAPSLPAQTLPSAADEDDDEDEDVESLLYLAQLDLIAHKPDEAMARLERAARAGSSAACASLAGLLARRARLGLDPAPPPRALTASSTSSSRRPPLPLTRSHDSQSPELAAATHATPDALRALDLYLTGLSLLIAKGTHPDPSSDDDHDDGDDTAEGLYFDLDRALDLVVGVTDAHRFGVLRAPARCRGDESHVPPPPPNDCTNDGLWRRSHSAAVSLLNHESIASLFSAIGPPASAALSQPARPASFSRSRSYTHPASSTLSFRTALKGDDTALLALTRKVKVTIAIHALYVLAVQAFALQPPSTALSTPQTPQNAAASPSHPESDSKLLAERYWSTIVHLAAPYAALGGVGIKEADELVERTHRRLESLCHQDMGAEEPWRMAKKRGRPHPQLPTGVVASANTRQALSASSPGASHEPGSSAMTIRPMLERATSSSTGSFGGPTPRASAAKFHFGDGDVDETAEENAGPSTSAAEPTLQADVAHSLPFGLSPPRELHSSPAAAGLLKGSLLAPAEQYPSPPDTPPSNSEAKLFYPDFTRARTATASSLSPPLSASRLRPLVSPQASASDLPRVTSMRSIASQRSTSSVLSHFKHDPLQEYLTSRLRRVTSSASVCTAPPDFSGRTRVVRGKGKGKMVDPAPSELYGLAALERARSRPPGLAPVEEPALVQPKTWLSRFWHASALRAGAAAGRAGGDGTFDRTRSSSAVHELQQVLCRHDEASAEVAYYWGERDSDEEGEVDGTDELDVDVDVSRADGSGLRPSGAADLSPSSSQCTHAPSSVRFDDAPVPSQADRLRASLNASSTPRAARRVAHQRSFLLTDPTSSSTSTPRASRSRERVRSRPASRTGSAGSIHSTTADGLLAPPSPQQRRAGRRTSTCGEDREPVPAPVPMDPLLLELERRSHIGRKTTCAACGRQGLNFPACRTCKGTYCSRECRVGEAHACARAKASA
ncbi:hypothetical protein JCM3770_005738 [Rhodotorula araucariae]